MYALNVFKETLGFDDSEMRRLETMLIILQKKIPLNI